MTLKNNIDYLSKNQMKRRSKKCKISNYEVAKTKNKQETKKKLQKILLVERKSLLHIYFT